MIYYFNNENNSFLEEKFQTPLNGTVRTFIWKSSDKSLGFNIDDRGISFVKELVDKSYTLLLPEFNEISRSDVEKNINKFKAISFLNHSGKVLEEYKLYRLFLETQKKNELLKRYGKPLKIIDEPDLVKWKDDKKLTYEFLSFCKNNQIDFIVWDWSNFGIYFYELNIDNNNILSSIEQLSEKLNIEIKKINENEIPYY